MLDTPDAPDNGLPAPANTTVEPIKIQRAPNIEDIVIAVADPTLYAQTLASAVVNENVRPTWWNSPFLPYIRTYRQETEARRILDNIQTTQDIYSIEDPTPADDSVYQESDAAKNWKRQMAVDALLTRVNRNHLHTRSGEHEIELNEGFQHELDELIKEYLAQNPNDENANAARIRLRVLMRNHFGGANRQPGAVSRNDIVLTNLTKQLDAIREKKNLDPTFDPQLNIKAYRVALGTRSTYDGTPIDRFLRDHVYGTRWGAVVNPLVVAGGVYAINYAVTRSLFTLGGFIGAGIAAGAVSATRERFNIQKDYVFQHKALALHETVTDRISDKRRAEIEQVLPNVYNAGDMILYLYSKYKYLPFENNMNNGQITPDFLDQFDDETIARLALYRNLIDLSDNAAISASEQRRGYDLISYFSAEAVEYQRAAIDQMLIAIEGFFNEEQPNYVPQNQTLKINMVRQKFVNAIRDGRIELHNYILEREAAFERLQRSNMAKAAALGVASGLIGGVLIKGAAELAQYALSPHTFAIISTGGAFRQYVSPDGKEAIKSAVPIKFIPEGNGVYAISYQQGTAIKTISNAFSNGGLTTQGAKALQDAGFAIKSGTIVNPHGTIQVTQTVHANASNYLASKGVSPEVISGKTWINNNTAIPDGNELNLTSSQASNGDFIWQMNATASGSTFNGQTFNLPQLIHDGKVVDLLSYRDSAGILHTYDIPMDTNGTAVLKAHTPLWDVFTNNGVNRAAFSEVATIQNGNANIFATSPLSSGTGVPQSALFATQVTSVVTGNVSIPNYTISSVPTYTPQGTTSFLTGLGNGFLNLFRPPFFMPIIPFPRRNAGRLTHTNRIQFA